MHLQGLIFVIYTQFHERLFAAKYFREVFALSDGEKIALDWYAEPKPKGEIIDSESRPLLVCVGGLGGGH